MSSGNHPTQDQASAAFEWLRKLALDGNKSASIALIVWERELQTRRKLEEFTIDTCDRGHRFAKLSDHPEKDALARCPHCMAIGLDRARLAHAETRRKLEEAEKRIQQLGELPIGEFIEKDGEITLEVMVEACRFNAYAEDLAGAILHRPKKGGAS